MRKLPSVLSLQADLGREREISHVLSLAVTETADATYRHRVGREVYRWTAYRLAGPAGGYLLATFDCPSNRRPHVHYTARLDDAASMVRLRADYQDGMAEAVSKFLTARDAMIERHYGVE